MSDILSRFDPGQLIGLTAVVGGFVVALFALLLGSWRRVKRIDAEASLKQDMLARGMSADEIRTVMDAGSKRRL